MEHDEQNGDPYSRRSPRANMREVAAIAGVAMSSVSRVLSGHPDVSPEMRRRVMAAVDRLGYRPDLLAQGLRSRTTHTIGFVVGDIANPLLAEIVQGAEGHLRDSGYSMLLTDSGNRSDLDAAHIRLLLQRRVDGLLLSLAAEDNRDVLDLLQSAETPVVVLDRDIPPAIGASAVLSDHRSGMRAAADHLLDLGHRRVGLVLGPPIRTTRERRLGLEEAYVERGLERTYTVLEGHFTAEHGERATAILLSAPVLPTAIVAGSNQLFIGVMRELRRRALRIGLDVSLISCDEIPVTELLDPPIAVVRRDTREIGRRAAELLVTRIRDGGPPETAVLATTFIPRPSCIALSGERATFARD